MSEAVRLSVTARYEFRGVSLGNGGRQVKRDLPIDARSSGVTLSEPYASPGVVIIVHTNTKRRAMRRATAITTLLVSLTFLVAACGDSSGPENVPDVSGVWSGQYRVTGCTRSGATIPIFCNDLFAVGQSFILDLDLAQSGASLEGVMAQGSVFGNVAGDVDENELIVLGGELADSSMVTTTSILGWLTGLVGDSLIGSWRFRTDDADPDFGTATVDASVKLLGPSVLKFFGCATMGSVTVDGSVSDRLASGDCQLVDGSFFDVWALTVSAGDSVSILLSSGSFDAFMLVADEAEQLVDGNDDRTVNDARGDSLDAEVIRQFDTAGTLLIIASSFAAGETGPYTLSVTRLGPTPSVASQLRSEAARAPRQPGLQILRAKLGGGLDSDRHPLVRKLRTLRGWPERP